MHYFFLWTKGEEIVKVSQTFASVTGIPSETMIGQNVADFLSLGPKERAFLQDQRYGTTDLHLSTKDACALMVEVTFEPIDSGMLVLCLPRSMKQRHSPISKSLSVWTSYNEIKSPLYQDRMKRGAASAPPASKRPPVAEKRPDNSVYYVPPPTNVKNKRFEAVIEQTFP